MAEIGVCWWVSVMAQIRVCWWVSFTDRSLVMGFVLRSKRNGGLLMVMWRIPVDCGCDLRAVTGQPWVCDLGRGFVFLDLGSFAACLLRFYVCLYWVLSSY